MRIASTFAMLAFAGLSCLVLGCGVDTVVESSVESGAIDPVSDEEPAPATGPSNTGGILSGIPGVGGDSQPTTTETPPIDTPAPETGERVRAEVGVAKQGQATKDVKGIGAMIVQPARSLFAFKQRAVFEIQIPQAMNLFKATEGRLPKSNDEFMGKIIKANNIKLPELPAGQTYVYDPAREELMVQKPGS